MNNTCKDKYLEISKFEQFVIGKFNKLIKGVV